MSRTAPCICAVAACVTAFAAGGAWAQTTPTGLHEAEDESVMVSSLGVTIDQLEDMDIYGPNGEEIGEVDEVLVDASAQPVAVSADVGGFLGLGEKDVVIGLDQVAKDGDKLKISMTKEQIEALPAFED
ncbi:MAG: PRC-barrel domain-containing protein [Geminicoccaceae bacterium]